MSCLPKCNKSNELRIRCWESRRHLGFASLFQYAKMAIADVGNQHGRGLFQRYGLPVPTLEPKPWCMVATFGNRHQSKLIWVSEEVVGQEVRLVHHALGPCRKPESGHSCLRWTSISPWLGSSRFCLRLGMLKPCPNHYAPGPSTTSTKIMPCPLLPNTCWTLELKASWLDRPVAWKTCLPGGAFLGRLH